MLFHTTFRLLHSLSTEELRETGLRPPQAVFLGFLRQTGPLNIGAISRLTNVTPSVGTRFIERLEKAGMVKRFLDENDRRVVKVRLTDLGDEVSARFQEGIDERFRKALAGVEKEDLDAFVRVLSQMNENLAGETPFPGLQAMMRFHGHGPRRGHGKGDGV